MERLAQSLGITNLSRSQVSEMAKGLDEQVEEFRTRPLDDSVYPILWVDALYKKIRFNGRVISMAVLLVCGVDEHGKRHILAIEPMLEESKQSYMQLFGQLKKRGTEISFSDCFRCSFWVGSSSPGVLFQRQLAAL